MSARLRVAISALSAKSYGGDSYFRGIIPALGRFADQAEFTLLARDDRYARLAEDSGIRQVTLQTPEGGIKRILWEQAVLPGVIRRLGCDVLYTANNVGTLRSGLPCVIAIRNMEPLVARNDQASWGLQVRHGLLARLTWWSIQRAARVVAVSHFVREALVAGGADPTKIDVVYHGIDDVATDDAGVPSDVVREMPTEYVAAAAKFVRYANLATLFRAYAVMRDRGFKGPLVFAGGSHDAGYESEIRSLVDRLDLGSNVRFLGYVPRETLQATIRHCRAFLFSSVLEACPFTLLEAMRQGAPIVATTAGPSMEFCGQAAEYVEPTDYEAFGDTAYRLVTDEARRSQLATRAKLRAAEFRWDRSVAGLLGSFRHAVGA
ncbi:MAG: glycosyltransferase family 4 protein [Nitrospirota bacterium]